MCTVALETIFADHLYHLLPCRRCWLSACMDNVGHRRSKYQAVFFRRNQTQSLPYSQPATVLLTWRGALSATMLHPYHGGWHSLGKPTVIPPEVSHSGHFAIAPRGTTLATFPPFRPDTKVLNATSVRLRQRTGRICTVCTTTKLIPFSVHT